MEKISIKYKIPLAAVSILVVSGSLWTTSMNAYAQTSTPTAIEIMENAAGSMPSANNDIILRTLNSALGLNIKLDNFQSATDYQNQLNVRLAAGNFPDLFQIPSRSELLQLQSQGVLLNLTPYLKQLRPTVNFTNTTLKDGEVSGQLYAISKAPNLNYSTYWIRRDWLNRLHLKMPTTIAQLFQVAKAFTYDDPNGDGKKDTYGIVGQGLAAFAPIFGAFDVGLPANDGDLYVKDGKLVDAYFDPNMPKALAFIRKMVKAGVVDPSIVTSTSPTQVQQSAFEGQDGIMFLDWPNVTKSTYVQEYKKVDPKANWVQLGAPSGPYGKNDGSFGLEASSGMYGIPSVLAKDPKTLQKVFDLLNYVSSPAGNRLVQYGLPGRDYKLVHGKVVPLPMMQQEGYYFWTYQFTGRPELQYLDTKFAPQARYIGFAAHQPMIKTLNQFVSYPSGYNANDADTYAYQEIINFIYGKQPLTDYKNFLKTLSTTYNFTSYLAAAQTQLHKLGFVK